MAIYGDGKHNENMEYVSKQEFDFYIDKKITMWVREYHTIELPQNSIDLSFLPSIPTLLTETTNTPFAIACDL